MRNASLVATFTVLAACASSTETVTHAGTDPVAHPEWVTRGSGAFGGESKTFIGVGSSNGIQNPTLARTTADNRARDEISKILEVYSASLMKDYSASTTAGDFTASSEEQHVEQAVKTFAANTMSGLEIIDHWIHPQDGTTFSLARLDLEGVSAAIDQMSELDAKTKEAVKRAAAKAFADLEAEEMKRE